MSKKLEEIQKRHGLIKNLISSLEISNQSVLQKLLEQKGVEVTQATLSRDLTELGIARVPSPSGHIYRISAVGNEATLKFHIADEILSLSANETLIVIKTFPGRAQGVALYLDKQSSNAVMGTIAGDDTIIAIPHSIKKINKAIEELKTILGMK